MDSTAAAASRQVDERNSTPDECAREMSSNRCPNRQSGQVEPLLAVRKACTVAPPILPIQLELETNHCPMELVLDADKYEEFQRDPYAYLGVDAAEVELDAKVCKGEQFSSLAEEPPIAAAVDVCDGKDDLGKRNRSSPSESGIRQTTMATPSSSSHYKYVARKVFRLPTELKEIVCDLLLDKCRPNGSLETNACQAVANRVQLAAQTVKRIWACMLWSVVETGAIDPCFSYKRGRLDRTKAYAAMADALRKRNNPATSISTTEGGIQPTTLTMSPSSSSPSHCLIRKGRGFLTEQKEILCNLLLDRCLPNGSLETNACQAVANQVQSTESIVKKVWASMLRSVVETGAIDPCLSTKRRRAPIDIPTAYACMAEALRRRNNAATAAFSTRPVAGTVAFALPPTSTLTAASSRNDQRVASVAASAIATVSRQPLQSALEIESLSSLSTQTRGSAPVSRSSPSWNPTSPAVLPRRDLDAAWYPQNLYM